MSLARTLRTARRIPPRQLAQRLKVLWRRRRYAMDPTLPFVRAAIETAGAAPVADLPRVADEILWPEGLDVVERRAADFAAGRFVYLNREADFAAGVRWRDAGASPLWLYQLQYLGCVADLARTGRVADAARIVASWRGEFEGRWDAAAWHPYPASLRLANLCVAAAAAGGFDRLGPGVDVLAAVHAAYVLGHVEHDVRGNHLIENARALLWAGRCLRGGVASECGRAARAILDVEIEEQVLADGGHFEMSPMYHAIVMRDLIEIRALLDSTEAALRNRLDAALDRMGRFLADVCCPDGDIPLLGDAARGFGPPPAALLRLVGASRGAWSGVRSFPDTGLHVLRGARVWAILDAGPTCPAYLPAHGQADALTVEAWVNGTRVIADPGVFDYSGPERAWGRSSRAHSTITIDDRDTSEVYGSFRVGGRAKVLSVAVAEKGDEVVATIEPFGTSARLSRSIRIFGESLTIEDSADAPPGVAVRSRMVLAPEIDYLQETDPVSGVVTAVHSRVADILAVGGAVVFEQGSVAPEFGRSSPATILVQETRERGGRLRWVIGPA